MVHVLDDTVKRIGNLLVDVNRPLKERFRALMSLKNVNNPLAVQCISEAFSDSSALLKHELAYCLGQMKNPSAIPILKDVLNDLNQEPIVRHEAAEALGAIGDPSIRDLLEKYSNDKSREVAETCQLALQRLAWLEKDKDVENKYRSTDPAPPLKNVQDVDKLKEIMMDETLSMFERYRAMFSLRDLDTPESALALTTGLKTDSSLFSHEVAFVLGQMDKETTVPALIDCLSDASQNEMVRHECAEALGSIATDECIEVLEKFLTDEKRVVRESCVVALDMCEYENSPEFEYAIV